MLMAPENLDMEINIVYEEPADVSYVKKNMLSNAAQVKNCLFGVTRDITITTHHYIQAPHCMENIVSIPRSDKR